MQLPRMTISLVMIFVAVVAIDCAIFVPIHKARGLMGIGGSLPILILQWGLFRILQPVKDRRFWIGYLILGGVATGSYLRAMLNPDVFGVTSTGAVQVKPGSFLYSIWQSYGIAIGDRVLAPFLFGPVAAANPHPVAIVAYRLMLWSAPQILAGVIGGLIGRFLIPWVPSRNSTSVPASAVAAH